jgi:hypothetical protein
MITIKEIPLVTGEKVELKEELKLVFGEGADNIRLETKDKALPISGFSMTKITEWLEQENLITEDGKKILESIGDRKFAASLESLNPNIVAVEEPQALIQPVIEEKSKRRTSLFDKKELVIDLRHGVAGFHSVQERLQLHLSSGTKADLTSPAAKFKALTAIAGTSPDPDERYDALLEASYVLKTMVDYSGAGFHVKIIEREEAVDPLPYQEAVRKFLTAGYTIEETDRDVHRPGVKFIAQKVGSEKVEISRACVWSASSTNTELTAEAQLLLTPKGN